VSDSTRRLAGRKGLAAFARWGFDGHSVRKTEPNARS